MDRKKQLQKEEEVKDKAERSKDYRLPVRQDEAKPDFHDSADFMTIDQREAMRELDDSQLVGPPPPLSLPPPPATATATAAASTPTSTSTALVVTRDEQMADAHVSTAGILPPANRKRGRPPKARGKTGPSPSPQRKQVAVVDEDEDVCFICFDGGSLVLCDRRGCPKAYHPSCIKRDEAFFRSTAKWNCGWHICSSCQKASYYMCYTCTYSLCKGCTKGADYVCVRDNKGFCGICMKTIMLIENVTMGNVDQQVQVDFDDKTSWEYLFKVYWVYLKDKESLTIEELTNAKNPWKGDELPKARNSWKRNGFVARKEILTGEHFYANNEKVSCLNNCSGDGEGALSKRRKTNGQSDQTEKKSLVMEKPTQKAIPLPEGTTWATKALLEFVAHMKNGDQSVQSPADVQDLLLEYIKRNNLRDPLQKAEVVCDARLTNLFRRPRVGHLEMLKLIDYHFLTKEKSTPDNSVRMTVADDFSRQLEGASCSDSQLAVVNGGQHITNKKANEKGSPINPNADEYAAIDAHNINLLYLTCNLIEKLLDDAENFREKVVGSFVRIRVAVGEKKQDVYRLVQVVGICKADEPYKVGSRTTNMKLEILNLGKKEVISIVGICDQDFSEDECRRLRETVKCGLIKPLKVGEIQEKAMVLQPVKVSDCLEAEMLLLNNVGDRASEKGLRKELRECVEKLELLKSPKELERRLLEIANVHMDRKMDPTYASEDAEDRYDNKQGDDVRINNTSTTRKGIELNSSPGEDDLNDIGHRALKTLAAASEQVEMNSRVDLEGTLHTQERGNDSLWSRGAVACGLSMPNTSKNQLSDVEKSSPTPATTESVPVVASSVIPPSLSSGNEMPVSDFETENLWNYQDPSGKIQGPFSLAQLRKWSEMKNIFPDDFRVWKINEKQQNSVLLTDALIGRFPKEPLPPPALPEKAKVSYKNAYEKPEHRHGQGTGVTWEDNKRVDHDQKPLQNDAQIHGNRNDEHAKSGLESHSIPWIRAADAVVTDDTQARASLQVWELPEGTKSSVSLPALSSSGKSNEATLVSEREGSSNPGNVDMDSLGTTHQTNAKDNVEKGAEIDTHSSQSTGEMWRPQSMNSSTNGWDSHSGFLSMVKPIEKSEHIQKFDFSNMPTTEPMQANENLKNQVAEKSGPPSWSTASSLVIGGRQVAEVAVDWLSFSSAPAERSVEQWDINLVSSSSLKPSEGTPTSGIDQLTLSSSSHPTIGVVPSWHSMVPEPNEFCSLVDESVSDLLAEVEAMESLGLPSPTSKMRYDLELTPGSDDDCFSPVERFSHPPDQAKSDALSSTSDIQIPCQLSAVEESLRLSLMPSQPTITIEPHAVSHQMPSHLAPIQQQGMIQNEPLRASQIAPQPEPLRIWKSDPIDPLKSFNGNSSSAKVDRDVKHSEVSVNQWDISLDIQPLESSAKQPPLASTVNQLGDGSNKHPGTTVDGSQRMGKGKPNLNRVGVSQGNANKRGSGHGIIQQQGSTNSGVSSTGNQGQSRHGSESRHSGQRDHRSHSHNNRDSGSGRDRERDRSSWNRQVAYGSAGNVGGGSLKGPSKGQRVCKFYESGCCKRGASCSYWHP